MNRIWNYFAVIILACFSTTALYAATNQVNNMKKGTITGITLNSPGQIRTWIGQVKERMEKDNDQLPALIREVEQNIPLVNEPATEAVLHSMLAEMYQNFYQMNAWQIRQRTPIAGYVPEDIREWPGNLFTDKINEEINASLQPAAVLQNMPADSFREIIERGEDSPALRSTLYDFLAWRALEIQPSDNIYTDLLSFRRAQSNLPALILAELAYIRYKYGNVEEQEVKLNSLLQAYGNEPASVEIVNAKLDLLDIQRYSKNNPDSVMIIAWDLATATIQKFPDYPRINLLRNKLTNWQNPFIEIKLPASVYPDKQVTANLNYQNIKEIVVDVYETTLSPTDILIGNYRTGKDTAHRGKVVYTQTIPLKTVAPYKKEEKEFLLPGLTEGFYEVIVRVPGKELESRQVINSTTLAASSRTIPGRGIEIYITDLLSGKPAQGVHVDYYEGYRSNMKQMGMVSTDQQGIAILPEEKKITGYAAVSPTGKSLLINSIYNSYYSPQETDVKPQVTILTDRKLYRPGQTIQFKGIAYTSDKYNPVVVADRSFKVTLYDANNQEVASRTFKSNEYGSFNGEFTIPQQGLTGFYSLRTGNGETSVRVEEYKRPTFFVEFDPVKEEISKGDRVTLRGKVRTFSGVPLAESGGTYRITRYPYMLRADFFGADEQVAAGNLEVAADGTFTIEFVATKDEQTNFSRTDRYVVSVMVTDNKGEMQEGSATFVVGEKSILLLIDNLPRQVDKDEVRFTVHAQTINGQNVSTTGTISIFSLIDTNKPTVWTEGKLYTKGEFTTGKEINSALFRNLPSGRYRVLLEAMDAQGRKSTYSQDIILYSKKDKAPAVYSPLWVVNTREQYMPGETAQIIVGSSAKDAWILYEVLDGRKLLLREVISLNNQNRTLNIPFLPEWKDGVMVSFTMVKEGKLYKETVALYRRYPDRALTFRPQVFRDKLKPGQQENWSFRITGPDSLAVQSEVLALMYDMSLDQIYPSAMNFSLPSYTYINMYQFNEGEGLRPVIGNAYSSDTSLPVPSFSFDQLDWQGVRFLPNIQVRGGGLMMRNEAVAEVSMADSDQVVAYSASSKEAAGGVLPQSGSTAEAPVITVADIRQNFNETAFFYPSLLSDKDGNVHINFTIPESNTTWNMQMLAHTRDMKYGVYSTQVITQKPVMVIPNLPRFVRKGDRVTLSTQIVNQTGDGLAGSVLLELFNPVTDEILTSVAGSRKEFNLSSGSIGSVSWEWQVPYAGELIGVRIVATSPQGSDGEQHILPIVSDEVLITESTPFYLGEENSATVNIPSGMFRNGNRPLSLTFEATANPIWYAVQALPTLSNPESENVIDWFNSYYSNIMAQALVATTPRLQAVITAWSRQGGNAETFLSQLEKNEELKQILLQETPWVLNAQNQQEQLQRLILLFDVNRAASQKEIAFRKLQEQQMDNGGWGWFKGFNTNRSMTIYILNGMAQLINLNAIEYNQQEKEMQIKALSYLDKAIKEDYDGLLKDKKGMKNYTPSAVQVDYLLMRSNYRDIPEAESSEAIRYFTGQLEKQWDKLSLKGKAQTALLMQRNGNKALANKIVEWFRKTATVSAQSGMYWANNRTGSGSFSSPIEVHTLIMELFREISPVQQETDRMKQWLLNQKRTQQWDTAPATMNAVYILLKTGSGWLDETNRVEMNWGDKKITSEQGEIATGYMKENFPVENTNSAPTVVEIHKNGTSPAWGAVYAQYFSKPDNVTGTTGALNVSKKLFIETNNGNQKQIIPVTAERPLRIGDKVVVRVTVRTEQEMNYVYLHDLRPGFMEPANQLSGTQFRDGIMYYASPHDLSENFFIERLPAGTFVLEYSGYVSRTGDYSGGIATIQCLYAPEYISHSTGERVEIK